MTLLAAIILAGVWDAPGYDEPDPWQMVTATHPILQCSESGLSCWTTVPVAAAKRTDVDAAPAPAPLPTCKVMAVPVSMEVLRVRIGAKSTAMGLWNIFIQCQGVKQVSGQSIQIAIAQAGGKNAPRFLTKEQSGQVLMRQAGGNLRKWQTILRYSLMIGTSAAFPAIAGQIGNAGAIAVNLAFPLAEQLSRGLEAGIPSVSDLGLEIPDVISIPDTGGVTLHGWSSKVQSPTIIITKMETR
jgi:hypothetical protein